MFKKPQKIPQKKKIPQKTLKKYTIKNNYNNIYNTSVKNNKSRSTN